MFVAFNVRLTARALLQRPPPLWVVALECPFLTLLYAASKTPTTRLALDQKPRQALLPSLLRQRHLHRRLLRRRLTRHRHLSLRRSALADLTSYIYITADKDTCAFLPGKDFDEMNEVRGQDCATPRH